VLPGGGRGRAPPRRPNARVIAKADDNQPEAISQWLRTYRDRHVVPIPSGLLAMMGWGKGGDKPRPYDAERGNKDLARNGPRDVPGGLGAQSPTPGCTGGKSSAGCSLTPSLVRC